MASRLTIVSLIDNDINSRIKNVELKGLSFTKSTRCDLSLDPDKESFGYAVRIRLDRVRRSGDDLSTDITLQKLIKPQNFPTAHLSTRTIANAIHGQAIAIRAETTAEEIFITIGAMVGKLSIRLVRKRVRFMMKIGTYISETERPLEELKELLEPTQAKVHKKAKVRYAGARKR